MSAAPTDPEAFFRSFLPAAFSHYEDAARGVTSVGSLTFRVPETGEWSLRLAEGRLEVTPGMEDDVMLQVTVPLADFPVLVAGTVDRVGTARAPRLAGGPLAALAARPDTARLVRHVPGSVLFVAREGDLRRRMLVTPGRRAGNLDAAECTIECAMADLLEAQEKGIAPMQLFVAGKLKLSGNVQIAMALAGVFA